MKFQRHLRSAALHFFACAWLFTAAMHGLSAASPNTTTASTLRQLLIESDRVVFLGDSITFNGRWVSYLTCWMESAGTKARVINMALPSETVSGLSETDMPVENSHGLICMSD